MEKSSHYYAILALSLLNGIEEKIAERIAAASQFVDDAKINRIVFSTSKNDPLFIINNGQTEVRNISTCHSYFKIGTFSYEAMIQNTCLFHFFPGNTGLSFTEKLICTPNPSILNKLIAETLAASAFIPERLGLLLHVYADSYAHQGFSGLLSVLNNIQDLASDEPKNIFILIAEKIKNFFPKSYEGILDDFIPAYGHGQALMHPDIPFRKWSYSPSVQTSLEDNPITKSIDNPTRYRAAFDAISELLGEINDTTAYDRRSSAAPSLDRFYAIMFKKESSEAKINRWRNYIQTLCPKLNQTYDHENWLKESFTNYHKEQYMNWTVEGAELVPGYQDLSWYTFIESVMWYKQEALKRLAQHGLNIHL